MSRQSKNARNLKLARQFSAARVAGSKGPARTTPKHGKDPARRLAHNNVTRIGLKVKSDDGR